MKKKISLYHIASLMMLMLLILTLSACDIRECSHSYSSEVTTEAKCVNPGVRTYTCTSCNSSYTESIPPLGHDKQYHEERPATCLYSGYGAYETCSRCSYNTGAGKHIPSKGHTVVLEGYISPTCTEPGNSGRKLCSECKIVFFEAEVISPKGHFFGSWKTFTEPTETEEGEKRRNCRYCDAYETSVIAPLSHDHSRWEATKLEAVAPTCTQPGLTAGKQCSGCGEILLAQNVVEMLGHNYSDELTKSPTHHYYECTRCGNKNGENEHISSGAATPTQDEICTVCGYTINKAAGIVFSSLVVNDGEVFTKVSNSTSKFSFADEIVVVGEADYTVSTDKNGNNPISDKLVSLEVGDNVIYVTEYVKGEQKSVITVVIRRRPMYTVCFDANGGVYVDSITVEEDTVIKAVPQSERTGYTQTGWGYDFSTPITGNLNLTAVWQPNLENFIYRSNGTGTYRIIGIKDKDVTEIILPDCVTEIDEGAFSGCASLKSITLPFIGGSKFATESDETTLFGYIFGKEYYAGGYSATHFYTSSLDSVSYYVPESLTKVTLTGGKLYFGAFCGCGKIQSIEVPDNITEINDYAFSYCYDLKGFDIPDSVTKIGNSAFKNCRNIKEIKIPNTVTSIGESSFECMYGLETVTLPQSHVSIGSLAFVSCDSLKSIYIPSGVTAIGREAFSRCAALESIAVDSNNEKYKDIDGVLYTKDATILIQYPSNKKNVSFTVPNGVIKIGEVSFRENVALENLVISDTVTVIDTSAFYEAKRLKSVTFGCGIITVGNYAFYGCKNIKSIALSYGVETIGNAAFGGCLELPSFVIPNSVSLIGDSAFYGCQSLESIKIPDSVTQLGAWAFAECKKLASVAIGNNVSAIEEMTFSNCTNLINIVIPDKTTTINDEAFTNCTRLESVTIGDGVTHIGKRAFSGCENLKNATLGESVTQIGERAFSNCNNLTTVNIPNSIRQIGLFAFENCGSLVSIILPAETENVHMPFYGCSNLTIYCEVASDAAWYPDWNSKRPVVWRYNNVTTNSKYNYVLRGENVLLTEYKASDKNVIIPELIDGRKVTDFLCAFAENEYIESIVIPDTFTDIKAYAFKGCTSLSSVSIGKGVRSIGMMAFLECISLTGITIPDGVTVIDANAFEGCIALSSITIPDSVTYLGDEAFYMCENLQSVTIGCGIDKISSGTFKNCTSLKSVIIPSNVKTIEAYAFANCKSLANIIIPVSVATIRNNAFDGCSSLTIYSEAESEPEGWNHGWNCSNCPIIWGYKDE